MAQTYGHTGTKTKGRSCSLRPELRCCDEGIKPMEIVTEADYARQGQAGSQNRREKQVKRLVKKYEDTIFSFFRELGVPLKFREIIRGFILASGGETVFEASYNDLTDILFKRTAARLQSNRDVVRYKAESLQEWQKKHRVELIRVLEKGRKVTHQDGSQEYQKTKYQFVLLDELVKVLYGSPAKEMQARVMEAVARMRANYVPDEKKKVPTRFLMQRAQKTIFTKFGKVFEQAEELNRNPVEVCQKLIFDLQAALDEISARREEKQRRDGYVSAFQASLTLDEATAYEDRGVEKQHVSMMEGESEDLPSVRHLSVYWGADGDDVESAESESVETVENEDVTFLNSISGEIFSDNPLENAALHYAIAGYPVFPLHNPIFGGDAVRCSCRHWKNCQKVGKHPRTWHGVKDATTDLETIRGWWRQWPNANIGLATGVKSGVFVLDIDPKSGGFHNLEDLEDAYGGLLATLTQRTGSNGQHRIFKYPDVRIKNSASEIAPGLDIRSDGGYIVAAPSVHASGNRYEWHGVNTPVEAAPDWLIALILISEEEGAQETEQPSASPVVPVHGQIVKEGGRNDFLFRQARGLVISFNPSEVRRRVEAKNLGQCVPPVDEKELTKLLKSAERYGRLQVH